MTATATPFLMFEGAAEEAMTFYTSLFADGEILSIERHTKESAGNLEPGQEIPEGMNDVAGKVLQGAFRVAGQRFYVSDSFVQHGFTFTPSISVFVELDEEAEVDRIANALAEGGQFLMPLGDYGFSSRFAWAQDRFGITWQVSLTSAA
ncbi:VOC family protein [Brevibacterium samyangense]|uniref:VOC family protein n=1 Tax=Brevibacterium samyangense TaxID=366888 RepID=A0ABP5EFP0_9MICO